MAALAAFWRRRTWAAQAMKSSTHSPTSISASQRLGGRDGDLAPAGVAVVFTRGFAQGLFGGGQILGHTKKWEAFTKFSGRRKGAMPRSGIGSFTGRVGPSDGVQGLHPRRAPQRSHQSASVRRVRRCAASLARCPQRAGQAAGRFPAVDYRAGFWTAMAHRITRLPGNLNEF